MVFYLTLKILNKNTNLEIFPPTKYNSLSLNSWGILRWKVFYSVVNVVFVFSKFAYFAEI